jgi:hypothetical protein
MKLSSDWYDSKPSWTGYISRQDVPTQLALDYSPDEEDSGKGLWKGPPTEAALLVRLNARREGRSVRNHGRFVKAGLEVRSFCGEAHGHLGVARNSCELQ